MCNLEEKALKRAARRGFPRRLIAQQHFMRGWKAERGDAAASADLTGSHAEQSGRAAARDFHQLTTFN